MDVLVGSQSEDLSNSLINTYSFCEIEKMEANKEVDNFKWRLWCFPGKTLGRPIDPERMSWWAITQLILLTDKLY